MTKSVVRCALCPLEVPAGREYHNAGKTYCSRSCQEYAALLQAEQAVRMQSPWLVVLAILGMLLSMAITDRAMAHDQYMHWAQPGHPESSCCNGMKTEDGVETGDCSVTSAKWERNHWWAFIAAKKIWVQIPDDRIVNYKTDDSDAHLCYSQNYGNIYCFRPPKLGM